MTHAARPPRSAAQLGRDLRMHLSRRLNLSLAPPDRVSVNVTLRCNLKCTMCTTCYDAPELSTDEIKGLIDQTAAWGVQVFNPLGGEPFMRADIEELLAYAVRRGFYVTVTTNGTLITEKRARALAAIPSDRLHLNLSLDGDEAANDEIRGAGMWKRAIGGYTRIREADARAGNSRRKILANTILHSRNAPRFLQILDEQAALGFDGVQILNLFRTPEGAPPEAAALWFYDAQIPELERLCAQLAGRVEAQGPAGYRIQNSAAELRRVPRYYAEGLGPLEAPCWAGWKELYINADGAAIMCDGKLDFLAGRFGDVRQHTLRELWALPALQQRRAVVKSCQTPCIQMCYLREESDSARDLGADALRLVTRAAASRVGRLGRADEHHPDAVLRVELSDVCPCDWEGCATPPARWAALTAGAPARPSAASWARLRDEGHVRFDRGFMGFEVVRALVADLRAARLRFGALALRWRGEPLLHPEAEPILAFLLDAVARGDVADRLQIETCGRFLTPGLAALAARPAPQTWIVDLDRGDGAGVDLLLAARGPQARIVLAATATAPAVGPGRDWAALAARWPGFAPAAGRLPADGDALWVRRSDHTNFQANARAREALAAAAAALGVPAELGLEDRPRRCAAPARAPTLSWDGKLTLCPADTTLENVLGEVTPGSLAALWRGEGRAGALRDVASRGVPTRARCADCAMPWSPNLP